MNRNVSRKSGSTKEIMKNEAVIVLSTDLLLKLGRMSIYLSSVTYPP